MKRCPSCGEFKLRREFHRDPHSRLGLRVYCKVCSYRAVVERRRRLHEERAPLVLEHDPWAELGPIYRRRIKMGRLGVMSRLGRPASRIIAVLYRSGRLMMPWNYALHPFGEKVRGWSTACIYFRRPVMTAGLTVLFEGK